MRYQTVIFDMDGTILETLEGHRGQCQRHDGSYGLPPAAAWRRSAPLWATARPNSSSGVCPAGGGRQVFRALAFYMDYYDAHARIKTGPYPGVPELLASLKGRGVGIAVVSNKPDEAVRQLAESLLPRPVPGGHRPAPGR